MSLFCTSCQTTRSLIFRSFRHTSSNQLIHKSSYLKFRHFSIKSSTVTVLPFNHSNFWLSSRRHLTESEVKISRNENLVLILGSSNSRAFCTKVKPDKNSKEETLGGEIAEDDNEQSLRRLSTTELEQSLTDEEKQILKELEEEERRFREKLSSEGTAKQEDYNMWTGDFSELDNSKLAHSVSDSHVRFANRQRIIQDVIEEIWNPLPQQIDDEEDEPQYFPRGKTGVFDLSELVDLLREENAGEIVAISLPKELDYADCMVIVTVSNNKHLLALATFVRKRFKMKEKKSTDVLPQIDKSVNYQGWIALDLGNIILHIFLQETRDYYDLETLWTVGPLFDDLTNAPDTEIIQLLNSIK